MERVLSPRQRHHRRLGSSLANVQPLCVDLDGTLLKGDALWEQTLQLVRARPAAFLDLVRWLPRGRAFFKDRMALEPLAPMTEEMFNPGMVDWLRAEAASGRRVHLVTAAHRAAAEAAAAYCGCFAEVSSTVAGRNLAGENKASLLRERYGPGRYDYAGNSAADLPAWRGCARAIAVRTPPSVLRRLRKTHPQAEVRLPLPPLAFTIAKALRPQQLIKNLLLFLPVILAHRAGEMALLGRAALGFVVFSFAASFGYCVNDLCDVAADRLDARKSKRPLAAGELSPAAGAVLALVTLALAGLAATRLPPAFGLSVAAYLTLTPLYSLALKRIVAVDVMVLAALYVLRVVAGGLAAGVAVSLWLLTFSLFFFLSLSLLKRFGELLGWQGRLPAGKCLPGRGYRLHDLKAVRAFGMVSAYASVLVFFLFINTPGAQALYPRRELLWGVGLLLIGWLTRLWVLAGRGFIPGDPIPFIVRDRISWAAATAATALAIGATSLR